MNPNNNLVAVVRGIEVLFRDELWPCIPTAFCDQVVERLSHVQSPFNDRAPRELPVCRYLDHALTLAADGPARDLAEALTRMRPSLKWTQNPNYGEDPEFLARYAYTKIIGPDAAIHHTDVAVGYLLLVPGCYSAPHCHPAAEAYYILTGTGDWWMEGMPWVSKSPGSMIYHPPDAAHAIQAKEEPLLALYVWLGDVTVPSKLI